MCVRLFINNNIIILNGNCLSRLSNVVVVFVVECWQFRIRITETSNVRIGAHQSPQQDLNDKPNNML